MNKIRRKGWFNESHRHFLAAKGVKTKKFLAFKKKTTISVFDDTTPAHKYDVVVKDMKPDDFLKKSFLSSYVKNKNEKNYQEWLDDKQEAKLERLRKGLKSDEELVPIPVLEYDEDGELQNYQEGRHRGLVAKELGLETIPVAIARRRTQKERESDFKKDRGYYSDKFIDWTVDNAVKHRDKAEEYKQKLDSSEGLDKETFRVLFDSEVDKFSKEAKYLEANFPGHYAKLLRRLEAKEGKNVYVAKKEYLSEQALNDTNSMLVAGIIPWTVQDAVRMNLLND